MGSVNIPLCSGRLYKQLYFPNRNLNPTPKLDKRFEFKFALSEKLFSFPFVETGGNPEV